MTELPEIQSIKKIEVGPNDRFILEIEVGQMPPQRVKAYLAQIMERITGYFPKDTCLFVPMRNGKPGMRLSVITGIDAEVDEGSGD